MVGPGGGWERSITSSHSRPARPGGLLAVGLMTATVPFTLVAHLVLVFLGRVPVDRILMGVDASVLSPSRRMWQLIEPIHATIYFGPEAVEAAAQAGYRGFWMGYFAFRLAPLGAIGPDVATAVCYGFAPARVARALPDAWGFAAPEVALVARLAGVTATLSRVGVGVPGLVEAAELIWDAALHAHTTGRVLASANQALSKPDNPIGVIWQGATTLREHRGDGHNAALVAADVTPVQAHVLKIAAGESDVRTLAISRGWPEDAWPAGRSELQDRGWLDPEGTLAPEGRAVRDAIEQATDLAAESPWRHLGPRNTDELARLLQPLTAAVHGANLIPYPNPIGLPHSVV